MNDDKDEALNLSPAVAHGDLPTALRSPASFDYAQLERRMWERVREEIQTMVDDVYRDTRITQGHKVIAAVRSWGFAFRLAKVSVALPMEHGETVEVLPAIPGHRWVCESLSPPKFTLIPDAEVLRELLP